MTPVIIMLGYAALLVGGGLYAFFNAPPQANAATALIVPGVCAAVMAGLAALTLAQAHRPIGRNWGLRVGTAMALVMALLIAFPAFRRTPAYGAYHRVLPEYTAQLQADPALADAKARTEFFKQRGAPDHDPAYLLRTLWVLSGAGVFAFLGLISSRHALERRRAARAAAENPAAPGPAQADPAARP